MVVTTGVTSVHRGCLLSPWPAEKVSPPEWHLDCDRSDPETVSSPVLSKGSREGPQVQVPGTAWGQAGVRRTAG